MAGANQFKAEQFIKAIPNSGGIISTIARRVGCAWHTAQKYINEHPTVRAAYDDECEGMLDIAESVLITNITIANKKQLDSKEIVDAYDARWYLARKGRNRGYVERQEVSGADGGPLAIQVVEQIIDGSPDRDDPTT